MTKNENQENQTLCGVMNYLNLTSIGLKRALIAKNRRNWGMPFSCSAANRLLMNMPGDGFNMKLMVAH